MHTSTLLVRVTIGSGKADAAPTARDEFARGPDGARYRRIHPRMIDLESRIP